MNLKFQHIGMAFLFFLFLSGTALAADYIVSGAQLPYEDANGLYVLNGSSEGVPKYTKGDWILQLEREPMCPIGDTCLRWVIRNGSDPFANLVYYNQNEPTPDLPPNDGNWWLYPSPGGQVQLSVTLAPSQSIPTLGTWGVLIMSTLLAGIAIAIIRKSHFPDIGDRA